jgi:hypothetical protein
VNFVYLAKENSFMADLGDVFLEALKHCLTDKPYGFKSKVSREAGISPGHLGDLLAGRTYGPEERRRAIAAALGYLGESYEDFLQIGRNIKAGRPPDAGNPALPSQEELAAQGFLKVDFSDNMKLAAGGGGRIPVTEPAENSKVVVHRASLGRGAYRQHQLQAFRVGGDSMEPVIAKGGIVLADLTANDLRAIKEGGIYVLCWDLYDGECAVKYLRWAKKDEILSIESENGRDNPPVFREVEEVKLIGRVVWSWREH